MDYKEIALEVANEITDLDGRHPSCIELRTHFLARIQHFDHAISRIGHHLHLSLAGVDTEDEHGPGGHSAFMICERFDEQANRIKALEEQLEQAEKKAAMFDTIRQLCGHIENASDQTVIIFQDDATRDWIIKIDSPAQHLWWYGRSLEAAVASALADPRNKEE